MAVPLRRFLFPSRKGCSGSRNLLHRHCYESCGDEENVMIDQQRIDAASKLMVDHAFSIPLPSGQE
jgi:hypothetical protein